MSAAEAVANVVLGYALAVVVQLLVFPLFALRVSLGESLMIAAIFTTVSIVRSYALRLFERISIHGL